jgi:hypothetical protein
VPNCISSVITNQLILFNYLAQVSKIKRYICLPQDLFWKTCQKRLKLNVPQIVWTSCDFSTKFISYPLKEFHFSIYEKTTLFREENVLIVQIWTPSLIPCQKSFQYSKATYFYTLHSILPSFNFSPSRIQLHYIIINLR